LRVDQYAAGLAPDDFQPVCWLSQDGGRQVYGHLVRTHIKKLGACHVLIVKSALDASPSETRYWVTSRLQDSLQQLVAAAAMRWTIETLMVRILERILTTSRHCFDKRPALVYDHVGH
jgi:hypothetical protein